MGISNERKPRLLFIVGRFVIGGHATDNIPLLYHLKDKYTVQVIHGEKEPDEMEPLFLLEQFPGLDMQRLPSLKRRINPFADLVTVFRLLKKIKKFTPDIIHTHGSKSGFTGRLAGLLYGKAIMVHTFHGHLFHSYFNSFLSSVIVGVEKALGRVTTATIALGPTQKEELVNKFKILPASKVFEIPLGLYAPTEDGLYKKGLRKKYHVADDDVAIGIIGRLVPIKDPLVFLKIAVSILKNGNQKVKFFIIGDGQLKDEMISYLEAKKILYSLPSAIVDKAPVIFTSWISNVYEVIYELDIVALTSLNEGTPNSLIEAQLCSRPVVAYNVGGVKDTFVDKVSGFLVEKDDITTFTKNLTTLIADKELRTTMGRNGKEFSSRKYSKHTEVRLIDELYSMLLAKAK
ncbi:MAG: glycosyltransferase family 1 protein [Segetibacter sp.]|nr:glycosyltransferase family 1 protein [Segetibacter sp.]